MRITKGGDIQQVAKKGKRFRTKHLEVRILASPLSHPRIGLVVPKFGHSAVERNRLKRRIREIIRIRVLQNLPVVDVVIRTRPSTYDVPASGLLKELDDSMDAIQQLFL